MSHSRRHRKKTSDVNLGFQIAPMIDVVFVIMLFFMVMAGAVKVENAQNLKLPGTISSKTATAQPDEISINIDEEGQIYLNEDPKDTPESKNLPELTSALHELKQSSDAVKGQVIVTIYSEEQAKYERIIDTLDSLSRVKISSVTFQAAAQE